MYWITSNAQVRIKKAKSQANQGLQDFENNFFRATGGGFSSGFLGKTHSQI
jgi:hypothetical protein